MPLLQYTEKSSCWREMGQWFERIADLLLDIELEEPLQKEFSKIRFSLFKDERHLNREKHEFVQRYLALNTEMKEIYRLCQNFRQILFPENPLSQLEASRQLTDWCTQAGKQLSQFVKTLESWWDEVVNACVYSLNNGRAEAQFECPIF